MIYYIGLPIILRLGDVEEAKVIFNNKNQLLCSNVGRVAQSV